MAKRRQELTQIWTVSPRRHGAKAAARVRRRCICGIRRFAAISTCGSPRDGTWFYLKTPIGRPALVGLFRLGAQARGRQVLPRHAGGESRHRRRRRAVPGGGNENRGRRGGADACISAPMSTIGSPAMPAMRCGSSRSRATGGLKPYLHVRARSVGKGDARVVLRSGRTRRRARASMARGCSASRPAGEFFAMADGRAGQRACGDERARSRKR